jgi:hypothetical protein
MLMAGAAGFRQAVMATAAVITSRSVSSPPYRPSSPGWWICSAFRRIHPRAAGLVAPDADVQHHRHVPERSLCSWLGTPIVRSITSALTLGVISWVLLLAGGYLGGALTFVYGVRVLKRPKRR